MPFRALCQIEETFSADQKARFLNLYSLKNLITHSILPDQDVNRQAE